jgi:hypothetical protein
MVPDEPQRKPRSASIRGKDGPSYMIFEVMTILTPRIVRCALENIAVPIGAPQTPPRCSRASMATFGKETTFTSSLAVSFGPSRAPSVSHGRSRGRRLGKRGNQRIGGRCLRRGDDGALTTLLRRNSLSCSGNGTLSHSSARRLPIGPRNIYENNPHHQRFGLSSNYFLKTPYLPIL